MALLGQLTVGILGDLSGYSSSLSTAQKETVNFAKKMERTGRDISTIGYGFQDLGQSLTNKITKPAVVAATAISGMVGALGFKRLIGMDNAQAKLKGLGYEGKAIETIMDDVRNAVTGTTHTMAEGVDTAAGALASGVKEGAELERYIKLVGDAAVGSNRPMDEMAMIFNRVQGGGRLMTRELNMIEMGMPGFAQAMANNLADGSLEAFRDMVTNGEVGSEQFLNVMEGFAGGMSDAYADTWSGMAKNVLSNIGIIGEALLDGVFQDGKQAMAGFLDFLRSDGLREWAVETGEKISNMAQTIVEKVKEIKVWWDSLSTPIQDIIKKVALFGGIAAVAIGPILLIIGKLIVGIGGAITKFGAITGAVAKLGGIVGIITGPIGIVIGVISALVAIGVLLYKNWDTVKAKAIEVFSHFTPHLDTVKASFQRLKDSVQPIMDSLKDLWQSLLPILEKIGVVVGAVVVTAFGLLVGIFNGVVAAIGPLLNAFINFADFVVNMVNVIVALFMGDFAGAWQYLQDAAQSTIDFFVNILNGVLDFLVGFVEGVIGFFHGLYMTLVGNSIIPDMVNAIVEWFQNMFQWVIDIVMMIVEGITEAFMTIYEIVSNYIEMVLEIITSVWDFIKDTFSNALAFIVSLVTGDFQGMRDAINAQMENIKNLISNIWKAIDSFLSKTLGGIWDTVKSVFGNIFSTISSILSSIRSTVTSVWNGIKNTISNVLNGIKSVVSSIWNGIKSTISDVVNGIKTTVTNTFDSIKSSATNIFNGVKTAMTKPIDAAKNAIKRSIDAVKGFFSGMKLKFPKISMPKLPKFSLKGKFSLMPPSVPKLDVSWNRLGGIFSRPTIFNTANAGLQGVGEAGAEAILPLNTKVLGSIGEGISRTMGNDETPHLLVEVIQVLKQILNKDSTAVVEFEPLYRQTKNRLNEEQYSQRKQRRR